MNTKPTTSKSIQNNDFEDEDIFDDSTFLANFEDTSFRKQPGGNVDNSANKSALNVSALCCDEELSGYDKLTGKTWIYPTNYPVREYQFNIIKAAILKNTLVSLPTGLGKTFIAAVVMYNFYRWYPLGKIVFTAPTRPLIAQQIEACYNIIAIPPDDTIEMTGHMQASTRKNHWMSKRVFFATPQVIYNDIKSGICPSETIRCLVIDEAHRARKNYAYCQIVSCLDDVGHKIYRLLALSATPGSRVEDVISVIQSLHIAHLELRTEECIDVAPYSHSRNINTVIVQLGPELTQLRNDYVEIIDGYARRLKQLNILPQNLGNLSKGRIVMLYKEFQTKDRSSRHPQHNFIMKDFTNLISLFHGLELLLKHGARVFLNFFDEHPEKTWIQADYKLSQLLERLRSNLGVNPLSLNTSVLPDGTVPEVPKDIRFGHPKFDRLKEIMVEHFNTAKRKGQDTRAIVFCEYRESVNLVHCLLLQCRPLIIPQTFVGQGASGKDGKTVVSQKQQLRVMRAFRAGACNALVATCVAEEGLDVGQVDLILCFDISNRSPIRLVQRCGRTGRERNGQVHILVTEGREHQTLMECMRQRDGLNKKILQSKEVEKSLYKCNPRMIPHDFMPKCEKMHITVAKKTDLKLKGKTDGSDKKGQKDLRTMLLDKVTSSAKKISNEVLESNHLSKAEFDELFPQGYEDTNYLQPTKEYLSLGKDSLKKIKQEDGTLKLHTWIDWQRTLQKTISVGHSANTEILSEVLKFCDAKRFEVESLTQKQNTQNSLSQNMFSSPSKPMISQFASPRKTMPSMLSSPSKSKVSKKIQKALKKSPAKNNGDIRALFSTATKSTKNYTKLITDLGIPNDGSVPTSMINLLVDLNLDNNNYTKNCYVCTNICDCSLMKNRKKNTESPIHLQFLKNPTLPDITLIEYFNAEAILKCGSKSDILNDTIKVEPKREVISHNKTCTGNFDLELDFDLSNGEESPEYLPQTNLYNIKTPRSPDFNEIFAENNPAEDDKIVKNTSMDKLAQDTLENYTKIRNTSKEDGAQDTLKDDKKISNTSKDEVAQDTLKFFGLDSIEDIFADYDDSTETIENNNQAKLIENNNNATNKLEKSTIPKDEYVKTPSQRIPISEQSLSPSILSGSFAPVNPVTSPILCSQSRRLQLSTKKKQPHNSTPCSKAKKRLTLEQINNADISMENKEKTKISCTKKGILDTSNKSMLTITQLVDMINKTDNSFETGKDKKESTSKNIDDRSTSPILFSQADKKKSSFVRTPKASTSRGSSMLNGSLIILDSDSDSNDTVIYDYETKINPTGSKNITKPGSPPINRPEKEKSNLALNSKMFNKNKTSPSNKRKLEMDESNELTNSPYFNKRQKLENREGTQLSMQEKILLALKSDNSNMFKNDKTALHFTVSQPNSLSQKENFNPKNTTTIIQENKTNDKLKVLQMYRRDNKTHVNGKNNTEVFQNITKQLNSPQKRKIEFDDSDDDFIIEDKSIYKSQKTVNSNNKISSTTNHKVRKKRKHNSFLDLEAEQSDDSHGRSGDELSDDSIGSIVDFICDENITHHEDMHAHYVKSVRSPLKGGFKIPELPKKYNKADILSQYVEEDDYEMDSFCVDSHVGLTQVNEVSELELAEIILKQKKKSKRKDKFRQITQQNSDDSPVIKRSNKNAKRQIHSDSDDSS